MRLPFSVNPTKGMIEDMLGRLNNLMEKAYRSVNNYLTPQG